MSEIESNNKALVIRIYEEMWNTKNLSAASEIFTQPEGVQKFLREFLSAFPDLQHTVEDLIAEGNRVVARFSVKGTHTGQWENFAPSGNAIQYTGVTIAQIEGNKIIRHHTWWDRTAVVEQIRGENN